MRVILTHQNADFDAVAALLAAHKLNPNAIPVLPDHLNRNVAQFVMLYQGALPFVHQRDLHAKQVEHVTLVDTQRSPQMRGLSQTIPTHIIDHHALQTSLQSHETFTGEALGATTTLLVEQIRQQSITLVPLEATLLALGIYEDTGSLAYGTTTPRDAHAAAWLLEQGAALDTIRRFLAPPLNEEQQALLETLLKQAESRTIQGYPIIVAAASADSYIEEISSVAHRLRDTLDPAALFVLVAMPDSLQLVCRSAVDSVDVGEIARLFGGGGHARAAAATLHERNMAEAVDDLWQELHRRVRPVTRVADLMSYGVQTVEAGKHLSEVVSQMRHIGHEGYPVVEAGRVVGLLTRRDADRALEHRLGNLTVREVMASGEVTLKPNDSVLALEQRVVESGWGQIPVVDDGGKLIGIVTRTDLIQHWARTHPPSPVSENRIASDQIEATLGTAVAALIDAVAQHAQQEKLNLYLVGGAVRDLLLNRRTLDIDFVVEGDAIGLASSLAERFGGEVSSFRPFGTAKWRLNGQVNAALGLRENELPDHLDFATARNEFYEHPTALPTVYGGSIKLDLQRRDFTINTLAVQLSPASSMGLILDFYGGLHDLRARLIRVLHSLSFVDDPTRILRAVRFEHRLGFTIEPRTAELIETALPMLRRITGERIQNELTLLLNEPEPERALLDLQARGALEAIHPAFKVGENLSAHFQSARSQTPPWPLESPPDLTELYWHVLAASMPAQDLPALCERLLLSRHRSESLLDTARLVQNLDGLTSPAMRPSQVVQRLEGVTEMALLATWHVVRDEVVRIRIRRYIVEWRDARPTTDGNTLRALGLKPGPCYRMILERLRNALLDGEIHGEAEEQALLRKLIHEEKLCNGDD